MRAASVYLLVGLTSCVVEEEDEVVFIGECLALFYSSGSCGVQWLSDDIRSMCTRDRR